MNLLNRDRINLANPDRVGQSAMSVLDGIQVRFSPEEQIMGVALALASLVKHYGAHGGSILDATERLAGHYGDHPEIRAVQDYVRYEL